MSRDAGMLLVAVGVAIVCVGLLAATGALGWFGRLPGDVRIERGGMRVYAPIVSLLLASLALSLVLALFRRLR